MSRPVLSVMPGRHPFELAAFSAVLLAGLWGLLVPDGHSNAIDKLFPTYFISIYYAQLTFWGIVALAVMTATRLERRLRMERVVLYGIGYNSLAYVLTAFWASGAGAGTAALLVALIPIGSTARIIQITIEIRRIRRAVDTALVADPPPLGDPGEEA